MPGESEYGLVLDAHWRTYLPQVSICLQSSGKHFASGSAECLVPEETMVCASGNSSPNACVLLVEVDVCGLLARRSGSAASQREEVGRHH